MISCSLPTSLHFDWRSCLCLELGVPG